MLDDPEQAKPAVWARIVVDFPLSLARQQLMYAGGTMKTMPTYIKHNALIGASFIAPFFVLVSLNALLHERLYNSVAWHPSLLFIWLIALPTTAIALNLLSLLHYIRQGGASGRSSAWRVLVDLRHNWPVLAVVLVGLGILGLVLGHDSVHCVAGNPLRELANWHQTWACVQNS
ncbi:MAG TPA: hypothetical protein VLE99_01435 [Candidatus Saccharimonadales bacterium]|nr:hypothetical protein [Candidatus Saccharimonadales bacterium]